MVGEQWQVVIKVVGAPIDQFGRLTAARAAPKLGRRHRHPNAEAQNHLTRKAVPRSGSQECPSAECHLALEVS